MARAINEDERKRTREEKERRREVAWVLWRTSRKWSEEVEEGGEENENSTDVIAEVERTDEYPS